jgi:hypothetical protein
MDDRTPLAGVIQSYEIPGSAPLLISNEHQAKLGLVKDVRDGICTLKDFPGRHLPMCKAHGSGLLVVNLSEFSAIVSEREYPKALLPHFAGSRVAPKHQMGDNCAYMGKTFVGKVKTRELSGLVIGLSTYEDKRPDDSHILGCQPRRIRVSDGRYE